ncbi:putative uncharacterized protein C1orf196 [Channa argus]|uniref:Uncharacterized protein n=1 Tax=Channa argus TaxID=215402 RepID=A0A6G1Q389_CHAAH|nr:putative uncharacterized protein C1orf196 [Channa argus]
MCQRMILAGQKRFDGSVFLPHDLGTEAVQSLNSLNDQIANFMVTEPKSLEQEEHVFVPPEKETLQKSMTLMRHLLVDAQVKETITFDSSQQDKQANIFMRHTKTDLSYEMHNITPLAGGLVCRAD